MAKQKKKKGKPVELSRRPRPEDSGLTACLESLEGSSADVRSCDRAGGSPAKLQFFHQLPGARRANFTTAFKAKESGNDVSFSNCRNHSSFSN